jgi:hypothetical protein
MAITDELLDRLRMAESGGNPRAVSKAGAMGAYQFMPGTAKQFGIDPFNEGQSREAARKYLTSLYTEFGSVEDALRAYNWGPGNMRAYLKTGYGVNGKPMPAETANYVNAVQKQPAQSKGRDLSAEISGTQSQGGRDLSGELMSAMAQAQEQERPGAFMRGVQGVAQGIADPINALGQLFTQTGAAVGLPGAANKAAEFDKYVTQQDAQYKTNVRGGQTDFDFGRMFGNVASALPLTMALPAGGTLGAAATFGAGGGALSGALQPVMGGNFGEQKLGQLKAGALGGAVAGPVGNMLGRAISPTVNPQVALLQREGVTPTIGQIMGGGFKTAEEKLTSVPLLGSAIASGQGRANEQFNRAAFNRALAPFGEQLPDGVAGRDAVRFVGQRIGQAYDDALNAVGPIRLDPQLSTALTGLQNRLTFLPKETADQFSRLLQTEVADRAQNGILTPEAMKAAESQLGQMARGYGRSLDFDQRQLGQAISEAQTALRDAVQRQAPRGAADAVRAANTAYANFLRTQRAASSVGANDGVFSASQLQNAVRALDPTRSRFARGDALMQDLSDAGKSVLAQRTPDSGTAGRLLPAAIAGGAAGGAVTINPWLALGAVPALAYTATGQRALSNLLTGRQGAGYGLLSDAARRLAVPGGVALSPALQGLLNQ